MGSMSAAPVDRKVLGSLSPSRAGDFMSCPLLFRYRTIDRLPESSSPDAVRGTLVHKVLEDIFDLPAAERTPARRRTRCSSPPGRRCASSPGRRREVAATLDEAGLAESAHEVLDRYFTLEDPTRLEPAEREVVRRDRARLRAAAARHRRPARRGPDGAVRVVDYKTGSAVAEGFEAKALFQLRFYALILWRTRGVVPADAAAGLPRHHQRDRALRARRGRPARHRAQGATRCGRRSSVAKETGDWRPSRGQQCDWCAYQAHCPAFGGTCRRFRSRRRRGPDSHEHCDGAGAGAAAAG